MVGGRRRQRWRYMVLAGWRLICQRSRLLRLLAIEATIYAKRIAPPSRLYPDFPQDHHHGYKRGARTRERERERKEPARDDVDDVTELTAAAAAAEAEAAGGGRNQFTPPSTLYVGRAGARVFGAFQRGRQRRRRGSHHLI